MINETMYTNMECLTLFILVSTHPPNLHNPKRNPYDLTCLNFQTPIKFMDI